MNYNHPRWGKIWMDMHLFWSICAYHIRELINRERAGKTHEQELVRELHEESGCGQNIPHCSEHAMLLSLSDVWRSLADAEMLKTLLDSAVTWVLWHTVISFLVLLCTYVPTIYSSCKSIQKEFLLCLTLAGVCLTTPSIFINWKKCYKQFTVLLWEGTSHIWYAGKRTLSWCWVYTLIYSDLLSIAALSTVRMRG